jgi:hypothetical protein
MIAGMVVSTVGATGTAIPSVASSETSTSPTNHLKFVKRFNSFPEDYLYFIWRDGKQVDEPISFSEIINAQDRYGSKDVDKWIEIYKQQIEQQTNSPLNDVEFQYLGDVIRAIPERLEIIQHPDAGNKEVFLEIYWNNHTHSWSNTKESWQECVLVIGDMVVYEVVKKEIEETIGLLTFIENEKLKKAFTAK